MEEPGRFAFFVYFFLEALLLLSRMVYGYMEICMIAYQWNAEGHSETRSYKYSHAHADVDFGGTSLYI